MQIPAVADRIEIAARRAHAAAAGNRRLTHRDAFLARAVVIRVVPDAELRRRLDDRREKRIARFRVSDAQRALAAAKAIIAPAGIAFHALEEGQDLSVAPAAAAHLRPGIEVLGLAADKHHSVNRAGTAEQFAAWHRETPAVGAPPWLGGIEPVGCRVGDQPRHSARNERPGMTGPTGLEQQYLVARVYRQPVRDGCTGGPGADNDVIVGLHVLLPAPRPRRLLLRHYA